MRAYHGSGLINPVGLHHTLSSPYKLSSTASKCLIACGLLSLPFTQYSTIFFISVHYPKFLLPCQWDLPPIPPHSLHLHLLQSDLPPITPHSLYLYLYLYLHLHLHLQSDPPQITPYSLYPHLHLCLHPLQLPFPKLWSELVVMK